MMQALEAPKNSNIMELIDLYDNFIIDVYGVLHDGTHPYPGVLETIKTLREKNKNFVFLSNAPRPNSVVAERLSKIDIHIPLENIYTSGDFFLKNLQSDSRFVGKKFHLTSPEQNEHLSHEFSIDITNNLDEADYSIFMMFCDDETKLNDFDSLMQKAADDNVEVLCPNPDKVVMHQGKYRYTSGFFANKYEKEFGGKVTYFGKPHTNIYATIFDKFKFDPKTTLAIGDSIETDITGANNANIASAIVRTGVHSDEKNLDNLFNKFNIKPDFIINSFGS